MCRSKRRGVHAEDVKISVSGSLNLAASQEVESDAAGCPMRIAPIRASHQLVLGYVEPAVFCASFIRNALLAKSLSNPKHAFLSHIIFYRQIFPHNSLFSVRGDMQLIFFLFVIHSILYL